MFQALLFLVGVTTFHLSAVVDVPMPHTVVLIVCKAKVAGPPDQNAQWTGDENLEWATPDAMMHCRRQEVDMTDPAEDQGAQPKEFNQATCQRSAVMLGSSWDVQHRGSAYRFWRVACPTPVKRKNPDGTEDIVSWVLPDCGHHDTVICELDTAI